MRILPEVDFLEGRPIPTVIVRGPRAATLQDGRKMLGGQVEDTLKAIHNRATRSGQGTLKGLIGLAVSQAAALGVLQTGVAGILEDVPGVSWLQRVATQFLDQAVKSLGTLLGTFTDQLTKQISGELAGEVTEPVVRAMIARLAEVDAVKASALARVNASTAALDRFTSAFERLRALSAAHDRRAGRVDKIVKLAGWANFIPAALLPQIHLIVGAIYLGAGGYVLLDAADSVDTDANWTPRFVLGVRGIVDEELA